MKNAKKKILLLSLGVVFLMVCLSACNNSNPPTVSSNTVTGTLPTFSPTPCNGVFGANTVCTTVDTANPAYLFLYPDVIYTNKAFAGLSLYCTSTVPVTYEMGIYAGNAGGTAPTTLLGQTGMRISAPVTGWIPAYFNSTVALSSGVTYWMGLHSTSFQYQSAPTSIYALQTPVTFGAIPTTFTGSPASDFIFSLYAITCP